MTRIDRTLAVAAGLAALAALAGPAAADQALVAVTKDVFPGAEMAAGGQTFALDMGTKRVNWNHAKWHVLEFDSPRDLSKANALALTVTTDGPRRDAGVYVGLREADGTWYVHGWAADLAQATNEATALFRDFRLAEWYSPPGGSQHDENGLFDPEAVTAVAVGCCNPLGVGPVRFTLTKLAAVTVALPAPAPLEIAVTGRLLDVDGTTTVAPGIFGTYAQKGDRFGKYRITGERHLNKAPGGGGVPCRVYCWGDRTAASVRFGENWKDHCEGTGAKWGEVGKAADVLWVEFWNEPYLNWANDNRINFKPSRFDESKAAEGGPVHLKADGQVCPHLAWTQAFDAPPWNWCRYGLQEWRRGRSPDGKVSVSEHARPYSMPRNRWQEMVETRNPPNDVADGQTYPVTEKVTRKVKDPETGKTKKVTETAEVPYTAFTPWTVYDKTQFTYWSGSGMLKLYCEPALAFGRALKKAAPEARFIVGWGFRPSEDHWAGWELLYKPTLEACIEVADAVHDHDYGSDPLKLPANYEVVQAWAVTAHGKRLTFLNTEQGAQTDPQAYPEAGLGRQAYEDLNKYRWAARKLLHVLQDTPDKCRMLCHFGHWWSDHGQGTMFEMLKSLRGRLVQVVKDDPRVFAVASIDGTDPRCPRPAAMGAGPELTVAVWNDHVTPREVRLTLTPPEGTSFAKGATVRHMVTGGGDGRPRVAEKPLPTPGKPYAETLAPLSMVVLAVPLEGAVPETATVHREQFFGKHILADVAPGRSVTETIPVPRKGVRRAWIKFVAERLGRGEGEVVLNGKPFPLPAAVTPENAAWIRYVPVAPTDLKAENTLEFRVASPERAGYLLGMSSLVIERE